MASEANKSGSTLKTCPVAACDLGNDGVYFKTLGFENDLPGRIHTIYKLISNYRELDYQSFIQHQVLWHCGIHLDAMMIIYIYIINSTTSNIVIMCYHHQTAAPLAASGLWSSCWSGCGVIPSFEAWCPVNTDKCVQNRAI